MRLLLGIYWAVAYLIYGTRVNGGMNAKFRFGGSVKKGDHIYIGKDFFIGKDFLLGVYPINGIYGRLSIGNNVVAQERVRISAALSVTIGNDVLMASDILITDNNHGMDISSDKSFMLQEISASPVVIGDGSWLGEKCTILPGSIIGEKCIIGANSVVSGKIPSFTIAVGIPAKPIKRWNFEVNKWEKIQL